jgi:hypothetical protein
MTSKKSDLLIKITKKLTSNNISLTKLQQIYNILNDRTEKDVVSAKTPIVEPIVEEVQEHVPWITFAKNYAQQNNMNYKDAIVEIKSKGLYKPKVKATEPQKVLKKNVGYSCGVCDYTTPDKSNFNRHMNKHNNKERIILQLARTKGLIRTHEVRAEKSKDADVRSKSKEILERALEQKNALIPQLRRLSERDVTYKKITTKKSHHSLPSSLIEHANTVYKDDNGTELGLTQENIENVKKHGPDYTIKVTNITVDDDEEIDEIIFEYDEQFDGYAVSLMQSVDIKGKMNDVEYDRFFVYNR